MLWHCSPRSVHIALDFSYQHEQPFLQNHIVWPRIPYVSKLDHWTPGGGGFPIAFKERTHLVAKTWPANLCVHKIVAPTSWRLQKLRHPKPKFVQNTELWRSLGCSGGVKCLCEIAAHVVDGWLVVHVVDTALYLTEPAGQGGGAGDKDVEGGKPWGLEQDLVLHMVGEA